MKDQLVRSEVIHSYTFIDEMLSGAICVYYFGKKRGFVKLWKTKPFRLFNYYIIEVLSVSEKLRLVKQILKIPKSIAADIESINVLRNGLAHAFFPQNLRSAKPVYKGCDIFTLDGVTRFDQDMQKIRTFFLAKTFGLTGA